MNTLKELGIRELSGQCSDRSSLALREKREVGQANALTENLGFGPSFISTTPLLTMKGCLACPGSHRQSQIGHLDGVREGGILLSGPCLWEDIIIDQMVVKKGIFIWGKTEIMYKN